MMIYPHGLSPQNEMLLNHPYTTMISACKLADTVIVDPDKYAVALKYDEDEDMAPIVVAKGINTMARTLQQNAQMSGVYIIYNPWLAMSLYAQIEDTNTCISEIFYEDVAEVLAYVYKIAREKKM